MRERALQSRILRTLNARPDCKALNIPGGPRMESGTPDILGCYRGQAFAIECKVGGAEPTPLQEHRLRQWAGGGAVTVVAGEDFDAEDFLRSLEDER